MNRKHLFPLLLPLSFIYGSILWCRNKFFDLGWIRSKRYPFPVISIGNITVGGTGKTPLTEYVIRLLKKEYSVALLSRGYKRKTKGVIIASSSSTAEEIGDEPRQIQSKFPDITVAVAEKRIKGIEQLIAQKQPGVIVMDDAFQHRYVEPGLSILVIDYFRPLWKDFPFPAGDLREPRRGKNRADMIVINKCPAEMTTPEKEAIIKKIKPGKGQQVFFTAIEYSAPVSFTNKDILPDAGSSVIALSGISHPDTFINHLKRTYSAVRPVIFPDHHHYTDKDILHIQKVFENITSPNIAIITTEKDMVRLKNTPRLDEEMRSHIWYIPIRLSFLFDEKNKFNQIIKSYVEKDKRND